ncbi:hypothetical protein CL629_02725 [bacterium]|nr:hypothetical protein [bacterium]
MSKFTVPADYLMPWIRDAKAVEIKKRALRQGHALLMVLVGTVVAFFAEWIFEFLSNNDANNIMLVIYGIFAVSMVITSMLGTYKFFVFLWTEERCAYTCKSCSRTEEKIVFAKKRAGICPHCFFPIKKGKRNDILLQAWKNGFPGIEVESG